MDPEKRLIIDHDFLLFRVPTQEGGANHTVALAKLIAEKDDHGLLLWGIFFQLNAMRARAEEAQKQLAEGPPMDEILEKSLALLRSRGVKVG